MLRKHFAMSGDNKPDFTITYHAPQHVPFFGGYAKNWVYGYPNYGSGLETDENPIKFKVIGDKWANGVGEWKFRLEDSSNKIYNSMILGKKMNTSGNIANELLSSGYGSSDMYVKAVLDENDIIISEKTVTVDNTNIITSVIFGEGIETINGSILLTNLLTTNPTQISCTEITLPESVTQLTGDLFNNYTSLKSITVPQNVIRIDNLCNIGSDSLEEVILYPFTPPDASNTSEQTPLGDYSNNIKDSLKIRVCADAIDNYKNDYIWGQYSDLYDIINNVIVYYTDEGRKLYTENQDITYIEWGTLPESITNVYLPNSVTSIGEDAFSGCSGLTSIVIPNSVTTIGEYAFDYCYGLTSVVWNAVNCPDFDNSNKPFNDIRTQITSFEFGDSVEHIPSYMCHGMSNLTSITIPNSVNSIGDWAFYNCFRLTSVVWNAVNYSDFISDLNNPFYYIRTQITSFEFGDSVEHIPAYMCCEMSITSITIPNSVTSIGNCAFNGCSGLTSVVIGNSVNSIGMWLFDYCQELTSIIVDDNNPIFDSRGNCDAIIETETNILRYGCKNTVIPNSVTSIGDSAFFGCLGLTSVEIPNSVTSIDQGAFGGCEGLTSVTIPNSVTSIGDSAFEYCLGLTSVTLNSTTPPSLGTNVFTNTSSNLQIYVPDESVDTYKTASGWSSYASKIKPLSQKPA